MHDPKTDLDINAAAQLSIVEACRLHNPGIKIIFASTRQIYGKPQFLPVTEAHPIHPVDINGIHKWAGESYHSLYQEVYGLQTCSLRLTNTYGPHMRICDARQTFLGIWFRQLLQGRPIQVFGDGMQLRDFNYVDDVVEAFLIAAQDPRSNGKVFNLGGNEIINLKDLASKVVALKKGACFEIIPFPPERKAIDIGDYYGSSKLIEQSLGWKPKVSLGQGLEKTFSFYEQLSAEYLK
jgi:dTDP-glucose 4,6-dehydratase/UDP-glucose 4-epimerase